MTVLSRDTAKAKLTIISLELLPDQISRLVGLDWDESRSIGDMKGASGMVWKENIWWLYETGQQDDDLVPIEQILGQCIERLRQRVVPAVAQIRRLTQTARVELGLYILSRTIPPIHLDATVLKFAHDLGADLDIDIVLYA